MLGMLILLLMVVVGIGSLVCFVIVVMQMFKHDETTIGIVCIVLTFCTGFGPLIAFVYGWTKAGAWQIQNVMYAWTGCIGIQIVLAILGVATGAFGPTDIDFEPNDF